MRTVGKSLWKTIVRILVTPQRVFTRIRLKTLAGKQAESVDSHVEVSIITIFLNAERHLEEAIKSVFGQTYYDWELILVDDGSTDGSTEIALGYVKRYPGKVRYIEHEGHENRGMSASRNLGIAHARGQFIAFLDADDVYLTNKLESQLRIMEQYDDIDMVFNPVYYWREDGTKEPQKVTLSPGKYPPCDWALRMLEKGADNGASPNAVLIRRDLIVKLGGFEESFRGIFQMFEDMVMWYKISLSSFIYYYPEPVTLYRIHGTSCWGNSSLNEQRLARIHLYSWLINYIRKREDERFQQVLQSAIVAYHSMWLRYLVDMEQFEAAAAFMSSLELQVPVFPPDAELNYLAAVSLHRSGTRPDVAIDFYSLALTNGFDEFWVLYNRGSLYREAGNLKTARQDLERAVELKPDHEGARQILQQLSCEDQDIQ